MNWDDIESNWSHLKSKVKQQWVELTGDDLDSMRGNREELTSKIQQTYGYDKQQAENEVDEWRNSQTDAGINNNQTTSSNSLSNSMYVNHFGYDETSSDHIQSGDNNGDMHGTNNLNADGSYSDKNQGANTQDANTQSANAQSSTVNNSPDLDAFSANYDGSDANDSGNGLSKAKDNNQSQGPGDAGGIPGKGDDEFEDDDLDEFSQPKPNPMPDNLERPISGEAQTPHQEKSIDQT